MNDLKRTIEAQRAVESRHAARSIERNLAAVRIRITDLAIRIEHLHRRLEELIRLLRPEVSVQEEVDREARASWERFRKGFEGKRGEDDE